MSLMSLTKAILKPYVPKYLRQLRVEQQRRKWDSEFSGRSPRETFSTIYEKGMWGKSESDEFFSGLGSHHPEIVSCYVKATRAFIKDLHMPSVVDLGCGDFNVGKQLRDLCGSYIACDVVPTLIERNRVRFNEMGVQFRCLDITEEALPDGRVAFVRQVFQHLNNTQIAKVIPKLKAYQFLVVSEHLPASATFTPNVDKVIGATTRLGRDAGDSGVVLTAHPFNLMPLSQRILCEVPAGQGIIRTTVYQLSV